MKAGYSRSLLSDQRYSYTCLWSDSIVDINTPNGRASGTITANSLPVGPIIINAEELYPMNYEFTATDPEGNSRKRTITKKELSFACLNLCGGGYTEKQTAEAMQLQNRLHKGESVNTGNGFTVSIRELPEVLDICASVNYSIR